MKLKMILILIIPFLLQGCAVALVGSAAVATKSVTDPRSFGNQVDDTTLFNRVNREVGIYIKNRGLENIARIVVTTYQGDILLLGQVPDQQTKEDIQSIAEQTKDADTVFNEIRTTRKIDLSTISNDTWITTKVRSRLLTEKSISSLNFKVVTENSEVFLLGQASRKEADQAARVASQIKGVNLVTKLIHYTK